MTSPGQAADPLPLTVFYDADCGFCQRCAAVLRALDRGHQHLELAPLTSASDRSPDAPPLPQLLELMHALDAEGHWFAGGQAWIRIADEIAILRPLAIFARLPLIDRLVEPVYALIANNRHRISHVLGDDACHISVS